MKAFHDKVVQSPKKVRIRYIKDARPETSDFSFEEYTGIEEPTETMFTEVILPCLYNKNSAEYDESFVGFNNIVTGRVYVSPAQLIKAFGTFDLDPTRLEVEIDGNMCISPLVSKKEELYNTCVAVEITMKDKLRG